MKRVRKEIVPIDPAKINEDVLPPTGHGKLSVGWWFNTYNLEIAEGCSSAVYHSIWKTTATNSQGSRSFYSTRLRALLALKYELQGQHQAQLKSLDIRIAAELNPEKNSGE